MPGGGNGGTTSGANNQGGGGPEAQPQQGTENQQQDETAARAEAEKVAKETQKVNAVTRIVNPPADASFNAVAHADALKTGQTIDQMREALVTHATSPVVPDMAERIAKAAFYADQAQQMDLLDQTNLQQAYTDGTLEETTVNREYIRLVAAASANGISPTTGELDDIRLAAIAIALQEKAETPAVKTPKEAAQADIASKIDGLPKPPTLTSLTDDEWDDIKAHLKSTYSDIIDASTLDDEALARRVVLQDLPFIPDQAEAIARQLQGTKFGPADVRQIVEAHEQVKQDIANSDVDDLIPDGVEDKDKDTERLRIRIEVTKRAIKEGTTAATELARLRVETFERYADRQLEASKTEKDSNESLRRFIDKHPIRSAQVLADRIRYIRERRKAAIIGITDDAEFTRQRDEAQKTVEALQNAEASQNKELNAAKERDKRSERVDALQLQLEHTRQELKSAEADLALYDEEQNARINQPGETARQARATAQDKEVSTARGLYDRQVDWLEGHGFTDVAKHLKEMPDLYYYDRNEKVYKERSNVRATHVAGAEMHFHMLIPDIWKKTRKGARNILMVILQALGISFVGLLTEEATKAA